MPFILKAYKHLCVVHMNTNHLQCGKTGLNRKQPLHSTRLNGGEQYPKQLHSIWYNWKFV